MAPVKPLPGRRALPALRFATAGVVLLLVLAFAVDQTNLFHAGDPSTLSFGPAVTSEEEEVYWTVPGERNEIADPEAMTKASEVNLVVPDGSDNVYTAVNSLATSGVVWGAMERGAGSVPQLVLTEGEEETASRGNAEEFAVLSASGDPQGKFAANDAAVPSALAPIIEGQDGSYLNILSSDNSTLYSFYLSDSRREVKAAGDNDWLRPLQYGLIGLVAVLGGATAALWLRQRRQRVVGVSKSQN